MDFEKIDYLKVSSTVATVYTKESNLYWLWWDDAWPDEMTAINLTRNSNWVSMLKDAIIHDLEVGFIFDPDNSSKVVTIQLQSSL